MKTSIYNQHTEHAEWLTKMAFYKDELSIMQKRLEEVISKNTSKEVAIQVEHFQNQLTIQRDNIKQIVRFTTKDEALLLCNIKNNPVASDHRKAEDHSDEREIVLGFEKNFKALKKDLYVFLSKWM